MNPGDSHRVLTINTGSSSLKAAVYTTENQHLRAELFGVAERIGSGQAKFRMTDGSGHITREEQTELRDHAAALQALFGAIARDQVDAVGHRVVHGGSRYSAPERVTPELLDGLRDLVPIDPTHLPQAISAIEAVTDQHPSVPQVACFDTAFHRGMPRIAQMYPLPRRLADAGVIRYGFHGLSYEYIVEKIRALHATTGGRMIVAHLGNGASMAAIQNGQGVDTTMGFTPVGGLMMGTRPGDLDPGVLVHLSMGGGMSPHELDELVNRKSGLLGVSGTSSDMRELLAVEDRDARAAEAVELFCYQARKSIGSLAAVLGGLDTLVFTGGIGEHASPIRWRICQGLEFLGIRLNPKRNEADDHLISVDASSVAVHVIATDEDLMIARHTYQLLWGTDDVSI